MTTSALFDAFATKKIIVLGDVMIDAYLSGKVHRVSPEAPVPIVHDLKKENRLGGAGNVALNLRSLGAQVTLCSVVGKDTEAETLFELLNNQGVSMEGIIQSSKRPTTVKTRVIGNHQQLVRIDQEETGDITSAEEVELLNQLENCIKKGCDALIFQDYNKGILTQNVIQKAIELAKKYDVLTTVDPKLKNFLAYKGVDLFKPNLKELSEGLGVSIDFKNNRNQFEQAVARLHSEISPGFVFVTLSEFGVYIGNDSTNYYFPAFERTISDVSGAGDTVISVATLCLAVGLQPDKVAAIANLSGGIVCEFRGVVAINAQQLKNEIERLELI